jgi:hypothetical protein
MIYRSQLAKRGALVVTTAPISSYQDSWGYLWGHFQRLAFQAIDL